VKIFKQLKPKNYSRNSTKGLFLGAAEAEAEVSDNSEVKLSDVFEDYFDIFTALDTVRFIVLGRKGTGKSALGKALYSSSLDNPNFFCDFVKHNDIRLEQVVQISKTSETPIYSSFLYEWIILVKLIKLLLENQSLLLEKERKLLIKFLNKNSGFTSIDEQKAKEFFEKNSSEVEITYLKRFFTSAFKKELSISKEKAHFYELLPDLKNVIIELLKKDKLNGNENEYLLIFDDLDIDFDLKSKDKLLALISLLRITRDYNTEVFGNETNPLNAKIILLLRDDIAQELIKRASQISISMADISKLFKSYALEPLKWYEHNKYRNNEDDLAIKRFINKRILYASNKSGKGCDVNNPWSWLVKDNNSFDKQSSFKDILDITFFRPRDLLLYFRTLSNNDYKIPLEKNDLKVLKGKYLSDLIEEMESELSTIYPGDVAKIKTAFQECAGGSFDYSYFKDKLENTGFSEDIEKVAEVLFNYSYIGHLINNKEVHFKHREKSQYIEKFDKHEPLILHNAINDFFATKRRY